MLLVVRARSAQGTGRLWRLRAVLGRTMMRLAPRRACCAELAGTRRGLGCFLAMLVQSVCTATPLVWCPRLGTAMRARFPAAVLRCRLARDVVLDGTAMRRGLERHLASAELGRSRAAGRRRRSARHVLPACIAMRPGLAPLLGFVAQGLTRAAGRRRRSARHVLPACTARVLA